MSTYTNRDWNPARNVPFTQFRPILENSEVEFYNFQRGPGREQLRTTGTPIRDLSGDDPEVARLAADLLNMDLLITVDTMAAHLAGALGKNVWVLLPYEAESIDFGDLHGVAYYSEQPDGFRVVATLAEGEEGVPVRIEATLSDHQKLTISVPRGPDESPLLVEFSRTGNSVVVDHDPAVKPLCHANPKCPEDS